MLMKEGVLRIWRLGQMGLFACEGQPSTRNLENAVSFWKNAGCTQAFGPVSPGAADLQSGFCLWRAAEKPELLAPGAAADERAFLQCGFVPAGDSLAFRIPLPHIPERGGGEVVEGVTAEACAQVMGAQTEQAHLALDAMRKMLDPAFCFTAYRNGPAGILICLRKRKQLRLLTLWSREDCRNGVVCVPMLHALSRAAQRAGIDTVDAAQIPEGNPFSLRLARRLGGREIGRYRQYKIEL